MGHGIRSGVSNAVALCVAGVMVAALACSSGDEASPTVKPDTTTSYPTAAATVDGMATLDETSMNVEASSEAIVRLGNQIRIEVPSGAFSEAVTATVRILRPVGISRNNQQLGFWDQLDVNFGGAQPASPVELVVPVPHERPRLFPLQICTFQEKHGRTCRTKRLEMKSASSSRRLA